MRYKIVTLIILSALLLGCGFHQRGALPMSKYIKDIYLETSSSFTPLSQAIEQTLSENNIQLTQDRHDAELILKVYNENQTNSLLTLGANQETRQYQLIYSLSFVLYNKSGHRIIGPRSIRETRTQIIQANQLLDNNTETQELYNSMRNQAVIDLMYQLNTQAVTQQLQHATPAHENQTRTTH